MQPRLVLFTLFLPLMSLPGSMSIAQEYGADAYLSPQASYPDPPGAFGGYGAPHDARHPERGDYWGWQGETTRRSSPAYQAREQQGYSQQYPTAYDSYASTPGDGGSYSSYRFPSPERPALGGGGGASPQPDFRALPPQDEGRYRFRVDESLQPGPGNGTLLYDGFRFRPLTEQEQRRKQTDSPWRPRGPSRSDDRRQEPNPLPAEETYGYHPDNWFRRYYRGGR